MRIVNRKRKRRSVKESDGVTLPSSTKKKRLSSGTTTTGKYLYTTQLLHTCVHDRIIILYKMNHFYIIIGVELTSTDTVYNRFCVSKHSYMMV